MIYIPSDKKNGEYRVLAKCPSSKCGKKVYIEAEDSNDFKYFDQRPNTWRICSRCGGRNNNWKKA